MSSFAGGRQFDQISSASVRSHISNMNFHSPLPLPVNEKKIPTNEEIAESFDQISEKFPDVQVDKLVSILYNNVIAPKVEQRAASEGGFAGQNQEDSRSNYSRSSRVSTFSRSSNASSVTSIKPESTPFKVHPNIHHTYFNNEGKFRDFGLVDEDEHRTNKKKKKRRSSRRKRDDKEKIKEMREILKGLKGENEENLRKAQAWKSEENKEHHLFSKKSDAQFQTRQEQVNYQQKRQAARAYCEKGYSMDKLKEMVWQTENKVLKIDKKRYKQISAAFLSESYRKLEQFLIEDCKRNIKPLTGPEMRALYPILTGAQLKFQQDEYLTLRKFIKVTFDLGSVSIFEQMAVKLFIRVQLCLRGRIGTMRLDRQYRADARTKREMLRSPGRFLNQRLQSESIWTRDLEYELIDTIIQQKTIAKTRDALKLKYGENAILNNVKELKARFFKILRISIKRLLRYASQYAHKVPLLVQLQDEKVKVMIRHPSAVNARFALCRLYKMTSFNAELLTDVINKVNEFCFIQETRRQTEEKGQDPVINSVTDKIKHNIKESRKLLKNVTTPAQRVAPDSDLVFLKKKENKYQHIVSLEHNDKLHYFRKLGQLNTKGGFQYDQKSPDLKMLQMQDGDDDSEALVMVSDDDYDSAEDNDQSGQ